MVCLSSDLARPVPRPFALAHFSTPLQVLSFWMFVTLMERYGLKSFFLPDLRRLKVACYQLDVLTKQHLPELHAHLEELMVPTHSYAATWIQTVFSDMRTLEKVAPCSTFPRPLLRGPHSPPPPPPPPPRQSMVEKVWDNLLLNAHSPAVVTMQVMLAILKLAAPALLAAELDHVLVILQTLPRERVGEFSAEALLTCAWEFPISKATLQSIEAKYLVRGMGGGVVGGLRLVTRPAPRPDTEGKEAPELFVDRVWSEG